MAATAVITALSCTSSLLVHNGVPAFRQDWIWPVSRLQCGAMVQAGILPWHSGGSGYPSAYPEPWWPYVESGALCAIAGVHIGLALFVAGFILIAALATYAFCRKCGVSPWGAYAAMVVYASSPVAFNEVQAGHLLFLASYALLPIVVRLALPARLPMQWLLLGTAIGAGSAQQQFFAFDTVCAALVALTVGPKWVLQTVVPAVGVAALFTAPQWIIALLEPHAFQSVVPLQHWEYAQSASLSDALRTLGYIGGYDAVYLAPVAKWGLWIIPAFAALGFVLNARFRVNAAMALLASACVLIAWGLYGPLNVPLTWGFSHIRPMAFFRELYDFAAMAAFAYAFLIGTFVQRLAERTRTVALIACAVLACIGFYVIGRSFSGVPFYAPEDQTYAFLSQIAAHASGTRFVTIPSLFPQSDRPGTSGGISPYLLSTGSSPSALSPSGQYPSAYLNSALMQQPHSAKSMVALHVLGVGAVLRLPGLTTVSTVEPALQGLFPPPPDPRIKTASLSQPAAKMVDVLQYRRQSETLATLHGDADIDPFEAGHTFNVLQNMGEPDPRSSWVAVNAWTLLPLWMYAVPDGIFTLQSARTMHAPQALYVAGDASGALRARGCARLKKLDQHFDIFRCGADPTFTGEPPLAISSAAIGARLRTAARSGEDAPVRVLTSWPFYYRIETHAKRGSVVVLREHFDDLWNASVPAEHVRMDGYANGWVLGQDYNGVISLYYAAGIPYFGALAISVLLALVSLGIVSNCLMKSRTRSST